MAGTGRLGVELANMASNAALRPGDYRHEDLSVTVTEAGGGEPRTASANTTVTVGGGEISVDPEEFEPASNEISTLTAQFSGGGLSVESAIRSETGEVVKTYPAQPSNGSVNLVWNGRSDAGALAYGNFTWEVTANGPAGQTRKSATVLSAPPPPDLNQVIGVNTLELADVPGERISHLLFDSATNTMNPGALRVSDVSGNGISINGLSVNARAVINQTQVGYYNVTFKRRADSPSNITHPINYIYQLRTPVAAGNAVLGTFDVTVPAGNETVPAIKMPLHMPDFVQIIFQIRFYAKLARQSDDKYKFRYAIPPDDTDSSALGDGRGRLSVTLREPTAPWDSQEVDRAVLWRACKYATGARTDPEVQTGSQHQSEARVGLNHNLYMWLNWKHGVGYEPRKKWVRHTAPGKATFDLDSFLEQGGDAESTCAFAQIHYAALGVPMRTAELTLGNRATLANGHRVVYPLRSRWIRPWGSALFSAPGGDSDFPAAMDIPLWMGAIPPVPFIPTSIPQPIPEGLTSLAGRGLYGDTIPLTADENSNWQFLAFIRHFINIESTSTGGGYEATFASVPTFGLIKGGSRSAFGELFEDQSPGTPPTDFVDVPFTVTKVE